MKKRLFFLPMVAIMMAACSSNETIEVNENKGDLISFRPIVKGVTRAADANLSSDATSFNVEAFNIGETTSLYFSNVTFTNSGGTFTSATKYYWPASGSLDFYAYSPITEDISGVQKGALSNDNYQIVKTDYKTFTITPSTTVSEQVDFIYANTNKSKEESTNGETTLNFRHAGAKIAVKVKNSAPNLMFEISGWKLGYLDNSATFTYGDANTDASNAQLAFSDWTNNATPSADNTHSTTFDEKANVIAASQSTAKFLNKNGEPSTTTDESLNMILIPQTLTAATAYASTTAGAKPNGSYIALKMVIKNNTTAGETVADATAAGKWAMWPIGGYNWEPGKKYTYTIDLAGGGYYETNQDGTDENLDAILEGAEIKFASVSVDGWADRVYDVPAPANLAELKAFIANGGDYSNYIGYYVDNTGKISVSSTGAIGAIAYIGTSNVDTSFDGSRIIVLSKNKISYIKWDNSESPVLTGIDGVNDKTALNGYANTQALYTAGNTKYIAAKTAWEYQSKNGTPVVTGSSGWLLPSYQQAKLIVSNKSQISTVLDSDQCWTSTEYQDDHVYLFNDYSYSWSGNKKGDKYVCPCFVY